MANKTCDMLLRNSIVKGTKQVWLLCNHKKNKPSVAK